MNAEVAALAPAGRDAVMPVPEAVQAVRSALDRVRMSQRRYAEVRRRASPAAVARVRTDWGLAVLEWIEASVALAAAEDGRCRAGPPARGTAAGSPWRPARPGARSSPPGGATSSPGGMAAPTRPPWPGRTGARRWWTGSRPWPSSGPPRTRSTRSSGGRGSSRCPRSRRPAAGGRAAGAWAAGGRAAGAWAAGARAGARARAAGGRAGAGGGRGTGPRRGPRPAPRPRPRPAPPRRPGPPAGRPPPARAAARPAPRPAAGPGLDARETAPRLLSGDGPASLRPARTGTEGSWRGGR